MVSQSSMPDCSGYNAASLVSAGALSTCARPAVELSFLGERRLLSYRLDDSIRAAREIGIRFHPTRGAMTIGQSKGGLPPDDVCEEQEPVLKDMQRLIAEFHDNKKCVHLTAYNGADLQWLLCVPASALPYHTRVPSIERQRTRAGR